MLRGWVAVGHDVAAFWGLSLWEYHAAMSGARDRLKSEIEARAWLAWHVAALQREDKLPDFDGFVGGRKAKIKRQDPDELQAMFNLMASAWCASPNNPKD